MIRGAGTQGAASPSATEGDTRTGYVAQAKTPDDSGALPKPQGGEPGGTRIPYRHCREETGKGPTGLGPKAVGPGRTGGIPAAELPPLATKKADTERWERQVKGSDPSLKWGSHPRLSRDTQAKK